MATEQVPSSLGASSEIVYDELESDPIQLAGMYFQQYWRTRQRAH